jgi:osmotically-inducible protein OsmY
VAEGVPGSKVKVVTENGVIYLLGKITPSEADLVVAETQKSFGVQKIVKVFDYLPE